MLRLLGLLGLGLVLDLRLLLGPRQRLRLRLLLACTVGLGRRFGGGAVLRLPLAKLLADGGLLRGPPGHDDLPSPSTTSASTTSSSAAPSVAAPSPPAVEPA